MKSWRTLGISLVMAIALLLLVQGTTSALVEQLDLDQLTAKADCILVGEVVAINSHQEAEKGIYTQVTISVDQSIKGQPGEEVVLRLPGGEVDGRWLWVEDVPDFRLGERTVVFLEEVETTFSVCGWYQGKFTVQDGLVVERGQSLTSFIADINQAMAPRSTTAQLFTKPFSEALEVPLEADMVEPVMAGEFLVGWQDIMTDDFEGAFPGDWTVTISSSVDAQWGQDDYRSYSGSYSVFCAKDGADGVDPPSDYPNDVYTRMTYGPFSLADATDAELNFNIWCETEPSYDLFVALASIDGSNFYGTSWSGSSGGWQPLSFDLTDVYTIGDICGQPQVWVALIFDSDESVTDEGVFIDDVVLRKYVGDAPQITSVSPSSGPAGTGFQATITGTDFDRFAEQYRNPIEHRPIFTGGGVG